jgi:uncharacterized ParB-like nuclease family protein
MTERRIPLSQIEPWRCSRHAPTTPDQPISVIKQKGRHRYRIFDGMHRAQAAKNSGSKTIRAIVMVDET